MLDGDEVYDPGAEDDNDVDGDGDENDADDANGEGTDENRPNVDEGSDDPRES